jgi:hypothetical protein
LNGDLVKLRSFDCSIAQRHFVLKYVAQVALSEPKGQFRWPDVWKSGLNATAATRVQRGRREKSSPQLRRWAIAVSEQRGSGTELGVRMKIIHRFHSFAFS